MASKEISPVLNVPLSSALFTVDTRDGIRSSNGFVVAPQNAYDINIQKGQQLFSGAVQRIALTEINMPWNIPNVNDYNNILFLEKEDGTTYDLNLINGFYTPTELADKIATDLVDNAVFGITSWTCTWDADTNIFDLNGNDFTTGNKWRVNPKIGQSKGSSNGFQRSSTVAEMMGFNSTGTQYYFHLIGSYPTMLYTTYVDVVSSILCKHQDVRDTSSSYFTGNNILARIYISPDRYYSITDTNIIGTRPFQLHYEFPVPKEVQWEPTEFLPSCNIRLQDDKGNLLYNVGITPDNTFGNVMFCGNTAFVQMSMLISETRAY